MTIGSERESQKVGQLVPPHGGFLRPLLTSGPEDEIREKAHSLPKIRLSTREMSDLVMLAIGAYSPLGGFMRRADYLSVVDHMRLSDGLLWPMPVTLAISRGKADGIHEGSEIALLDPAGSEIVAQMTVEEKFGYDVHHEALQVYGTDDPEHPGVAGLGGRGDTYVGGPVTVFSEGGYPERFPEFARPVETRAIFESRGWSTVAAFQTRNPLHRSHEYLTKVALEISDGLLLHPVVGELKAGDIPAEVRVECYRVLLDHYYPKERVLLKVYPMEMRYAGPREAVLHAVIRQNFGCSHLVIGRDHAGVGTYYGPFDAQNIFDGLQPGDLFIKPLKLDITFWCTRCGGMASLKTCPHSPEDRVSIIGTRLREMLEKGERPPV